MKFALIALVATVSAANKAVVQEFPTNCDKVRVTSSDPYKACSGSVCCAFSDGQGSDLKRCMTAAQRGGPFSGKYTDDQEANFTWTCPQPAAGAGGAAAATGASSLIAGLATTVTLAALNF